MLIVFLLFALFRLPKGAPLTDNHADTPELIGDGRGLLPRADITFGTRQTSDIVISCLATIFACTWTAVHPNIPSPMDSRWDLFKRRIIMTTYALLAPEFITAWALRQFIGAKAIVKIYNSKIATPPHQRTDTHRHPSLRKLWRSFKKWLFHAPPLLPPLDGEVRPWTMTHGFFVQMGGFMLCENGKPIQSTSFGITCNIKEPNAGLQHFILSGAIDAPRITADEINDRSKGDAISKGLVIFQTTWFIIQCFARWSAHIFVTELEVITLAFAMLNGITYALWWNKPQNIGIPVSLEKRAPFIPPGNINEHTSPDPSEGGQNSSIKSASLRKNEIPPLVVPATVEAPAHMENRRVSEDLQAMLGAEDVERKISPDENKISPEDMKVAPKNYGQGTTFQWEQAPEDAELGITILERPVSIALPPTILFIPSARGSPTQPVVRPFSTIYRNTTEDTVALFYAEDRLQRLGRTTKRALSNGIRALFSVSERFILAALHPIGKLARPDLSHPGLGGLGLGQLRVPMFFVEQELGLGPALNALVLTSLISLLFGCVHFIPSFFLYYPSRTEIWLWRISAGIIICQSLIALITLMFEYKHLHSSSRSCRAWFMVKSFFERMCYLAIGHGMHYYIIARITLITLSFLSLRNLPDDAFFTIDWVLSIPHL